MSDLCGLFCISVTKLLCLVDRFNVGDKVRVSVDSDKRRFHARWVVCRLSRLTPFSLPHPISLPLPLSSIHTPLHAYLQPPDFTVQDIYWMLHL